MRRRALALAGALLAGGCASDKLTLLENEGAADTGAVAVLTTDGESVIDRPMTEVKLRSRPSKPRAIRELKPAYTALLQNLPPKAREFRILFPPNESKIPADQRSILEDIRAELSIRPGAQIEVAGFTDSSGDETNNNKISKDRAEGVAQELREFGFTVDSEDAVGRGEYDAQAKLGDGVQDPNYRRAVVIVR